MRKDVKAGMGLALVAVVVAGWYYTRSGSKDESIALGPQKPKVENRAADKPAATAAPRATHRPTTAERRAPQTASPATTAQRPATPPPVAAPPVATPTPAPVVATALTGDPAPAPATAIGADDEEAAEREEEMRAPEASVPGAATRTAPAAGPATASAAEPLEFYRVQPGDTLSRLAEVYYGNRAYADLILSVNPSISDPDRLRAGMEIQLPAVPAGGTPTSVPVTAAAPAPTAPAAGTPAGAAATTTAAGGAARTYVVRTGDSFYAIAQRELGSGGRWQELFGLNRELVGNDPKALKPGMKLRLPEK